MLLQAAATAATMRPPRTSLTRGALLRQAAAATATTAASGAALAVPPMEMLEKAQAEQAAPAVLYTPPSIKGLSSPEQIALAEHLKKTGAAFYGAYWCSFCLQQRSMFGAGGSRKLPYVECAPDGYQSSSALCRSKPDVRGYPTWEIGGKYYGGLRSLSELQALSGFDASVKFAEYVPPPPPPRPPPPPGGYRPPVVSTTSSAYQLALAQHLKKSGATFYGAHCTSGTIHSHPLASVCMAAPNPGTLKPGIKVKWCVRALLTWPSAIRDSLVLRRVWVLQQATRSLRIGCSGRAAVRGVCCRWLSEQGRAVSHEARGDRLPRVGDRGTVLWRDAIARRPRSAQRL